MNRWFLIVGTLGVVATSGYAGWALHRAKTAEGERVRDSQLRAVTDSARAMLTRDSVASVLRIRADSIQMAALLSANRRQAHTAAALRQAADHMTALATSARDSLAVIPVYQSALHAARLAIDTLAVARDVAISQRDSANAATGRLRAVMARQIVVLDSIARIRPSVPVIPEKKYLGLFRVKPCLFTGVGVTFRPTAGVGVCVTP